MKLIIVLGTRPEIIRLSCIIKKAKRIFEHCILVHTGQNYDPNLSDVFFRDLEIPKPDYFLACSKNNCGEMVADVIKKSYNLFKKLEPDALLILGDTNSGMCAYSAKRQKIPIFHIEAGNRCFDPNCPEEINRGIIDKICDVNLCYTENSKQNLILEGICRYVFVVGTPLAEVLSLIPEASEEKRNRLLKNLNLESKNYFLLSIHREENINISQNFRQIIKCIEKISNTYNKTILISIHPRTEKELTKYDVKFDENVILSKPFDLSTYCCLQKHAYCVVSDSGSLTEEASILKFPAVLLRTSTERQEGVDSGNIVIGTIEPENICRSIDLAVQFFEINLIPSYQHTNVSSKVCKIISGYTDIINKFVWMKPEA